MKIAPSIFAAGLSLLAANPALANETDSEQAPVNAQANDNPATAATAEIAKKSPPKKTEWQFKPRWRLQYDVANIDGPDGLIGTGNYDAIRRTQLGVDIKMPKGFSARVEADLNIDPIEFVDAYIAWDGNGVNVTAGQHKPMTPLDDMTSDLNTSFMERAAFSTAFGYARRTGISAGYTKGEFAINGGIFTEPLIQLNDVQDNSVSADFRAHWSPKAGATKLHFGAAYHYRDLNDVGDAATRYRQRPLIRITDTRYIGTPGLTVAKEHKFGFEAAAVNGRFHGVAEIHRLNAVRPGLSNPAFFGGYGEVGVFLTNDSRPLKGGTFGAIKPKNPLGKGGIGALQLNVRYDYLDLNSKGITGGKQNGYLASLIWNPNEYMRLLVNYARLNYTDAAIAVGTDRNYAVDVIGVRGQLTF
jgi:phosphate-selective porin OprO and OprP